MIKPQPIETQKVKTRDITFDMMKGLGIVFVLLGHVWPPIPYLHHFIFSFHMPLFFIVAGYFSRSYSPEVPLSKTIRHYANRLIPPFLFTAVSIFLWIFLKGYIKGDRSPAIVRFIAVFWADVTPLKTSWGSVNIGVIWFLLALFWAKSFLLILTRWKKWVLPISFVLSIGALLLHQVFPYSVWCISLGFLCLPFVAIVWWCRRNKIPSWLKILVVMVWIVSLGLSKMDIYSYEFGFYPTDVLAAFGGTYVIYLVCKMLNSDKVAQVIYPQKALAYLGAISLAIMCFHDFEIASHFGNHLRAFLGIDFPVWGWYVWRYAITIVAAMIIVKIPGLKKIFT